MDKKNLVVAIDGPAGAGKSTIAKKIAQELGLEYIDTGAMYRALTLKIINKGIHISDKEKIIETANSTSIKFVDKKIFLDGLPVDHDIRKAKVNELVSPVAKIKEVREILVGLQREMAQDTSIIMDGRDIGTVVLKDADFKFFLTASVEERAKRRYLEMLETKGQNTNYNHILANIKKRDTVDSTRKVAPLKKAVDAYEIDSTDKTIDETVREIISIIKGG